MPELVSLQSVGAAYDTPSPRSQRQKLVVVGPIFHGKLATHGGELEDEE
jgi:hypothetical protein